MKRYFCISFFYCFLISSLAYGQQILSNAAHELLPAYQSDNTVLLEAMRAKHNIDPDRLLAIATATNCPRLVEHLLQNYRQLEDTTYAAHALFAVNQRLIEVFVKHHVTLGKSPINSLIEGAIKNPDIEFTSQDFDEAVIEELIPSQMRRAYLKLIAPIADDAKRVAVATWLIGQGADFDYRGLGMLKRLPNDYKPIFKLLIDRLTNLPTGQSPPGFDSQIEALRLVAVLTNDESALRHLMADDEQFDLNSGRPPLLMYAVNDAGLPLIKLLLSRGANANWQDTTSGQSIFYEVLKRGDRAIFRELFPRFTNVNLIDPSGNTPVLFCLKTFMDLAPADSSRSKRLFYLAALKDLARRGSSFGRLPGIRQPIDFLPETIADLIALEVVLTVVDQTADQNALEDYAGRFGFQQITDMPILNLLCQRLVRIDLLLYNNGLSKAKLLPVVLRQAASLPALNVFSRLLYIACSKGDEQKIRWLLNDVPAAYLLRNPHFNVDSARRIIANTPVSGCNENALYFFLHSNRVVSFENKSILKALIAAGGDLYQEQTCDQKKPIDLLLGSTDFQKAYCDEIIFGLIKDLDFAFEGPNSWVKAPGTPDLYRKSILAYQADYKWVENLRLCSKMDVSGSEITGGAERQVRITGFGLINLGRFPVQGCEPISLGTHVSNGRTVFSFQTKRTYGDYNAFPFFYGRKDPVSKSIEFSLDGDTNLEQFNFVVDAQIDIPAAPLNAQDHSIPPMFIIRNNNDPIQVWQNNAPTLMGQGTTHFFDRSRGPLQIKFQRTTSRPNVGLELFGHLHDTNFPNLIVPPANDELARLHLYSEIVRLRRQPPLRNHSAEDQAIIRKQDSVIIHLLSEYALQRRFPAKVKEEYENSIRNLSNINRLLGPLGNFYEQHAVINFDHVSELMQKLETLIAAPDMSAAQRQLFTDLKNRLGSAGELRDLAESYSQLMNTELVKQARAQLDVRQRLGLEMEKYAVGGHLQLESVK